MRTITSIIECALTFGTELGAKTCRTLMRARCLDAVLGCLIGSFSAVAFGASAAEPFPCSNCFVGELKLSKNPSDPSGKTKILDEDLYFIEPDNTAWKAGKGDVTDGASIPKLFQPIIGGPWEEDYLPAAVMHDHYTKRLVRTWWTTDRMFHQAMIVKKVPSIKAAVMYYAVYAFGPHWAELEDGTPCGPNCTFISPITTGPVTLGALTYQRADYDLSHAPELKEVEQQVANAEAKGTPMTLSDLESLAAARHNDNPFLRIKEKK